MVREIFLLFLILGILSKSHASLMDLPEEVLGHISKLSDSRKNLRLTCRAFRDVIDEYCPMPLCIDIHNQKEILESDSTLLQKVEWISLWPQIVLDYRGEKLIEIFKRTKKVEVISFCTNQTVYGRLNDEVATAILKSAPNLESVFMPGCPKLTDEALEALPDCLKSLSLYEDKKVTEVGLIEFLKHKRNLMRFHLESKFALTDNVLEMLPRGIPIVGFGSNLLTPVRLCRFFKQAQSLEWVALKHPTLLDGTVFQALPGTLLVLEIESNSVTENDVVKLLERSQRLTELKVTGEIDLRENFFDALPSSLTSLNLKIDWEKFETNDVGSKGKNAIIEFLKRAKKLSCLDFGSYSFNGVWDFLPGNVTDKIEISSRTNEEEVVRFLKRARELREVMFERDSLLTSGILDAMPGNIRKLVISEPKYVDNEALGRLFQHSTCLSSVECYHLRHNNREMQEGCLDVKVFRYIPVTLQDLSLSCSNITDEEITILLPYLTNFPGSLSLPWSLTNLRFFRLLPRSLKCLDLSCRSSPAITYDVPSPLLLQAMAMRQESMSDNKFLKWLMEESLKIIEASLPETVKPFEMIEFLKESKNLRELDISMHTQGHAFVESILDALAEGVAPQLNAICLNGLKYKAPESFLEKVRRLQQVREWLIVDYY